MDEQQRIYRDPNQPPRRSDYGECYARRSGVPCPLSGAGGVCMNCHAYRAARYRWEHRQAAASATGAMSE